MKHLITCFCFFISISFSSYAEEIIDTLYYDKDWKGVESSQFATFYRIYNPNAQSGFRKLCRDYYITGELQSESSYISIDPYDDSNSVFDGEYISYFKNGKIEQKGTINNGVEQGEHIKYDEDGNIILKANFKDGKLHGLYTEYDSNGVCLQKEFKDGTPIYDYYIISNRDGLFSKISTIDNTPLFSTPSQNDLRIEYNDGTVWKYYINDGICIMLTCEEINDYGKYYRIHIKFTNNTFYPIVFDPIESEAILTNKKCEQKTLEIQTSEQYDKRIKRTQMWEEILVSFTEGLAASGAGYSQSTSRSSYNSYGAYSPYYGNTSYYGSSTSTTTTYNASAAYAAQMAASQKIERLTENNSSKRQARNEGYLKKTTVYSAQSISGYINIKRKKGESLLIKLNIAGVLYEFPWDISKKK